MTPHAANQGKSFKGVAAYIIHDPDRAKTSERVLFTQTLNLRTDDPQKAAKVMAYTAAHASFLKQAAGVKAGGRKSQNPVYHFSLSWVPGEQPSQAEMMEAAEQALEVLGFGGMKPCSPRMAINPISTCILSLIVFTQKQERATTRTTIIRACRNGLTFTTKRGVWNTTAPSAPQNTRRTPSRKRSIRNSPKRYRSKEGVANHNVPRPQYEAEKGATHPRSKLYQEIRETFAARTKNLAIETREAATRHKTQWQTLKDRHKQERAALWDEQQAAFKARNSFNRSSKVRPLPSYTWDQYQKDRTALREQHKAEFHTLLSTLKMNDEPQVKAFFQKQRSARAEFMQKHKERLTALTKNLKATTQTPVGKQGQEHQGHLARMFNEVVAKDWRTRQFIAREEREKGEFFASLKAQNQPAIETLRASHYEQGGALLAKLNAAREDAKQEQARKIQAPSKPTVTNGQTSRTSTAPSVTTSSRTKLESGASYKVNGPASTMTALRPGRRTGSSALSKKREPPKKRPRTDFVTPSPALPIQAARLRKPAGVIRAETAVLKVQVEAAAATSNATKRLFLR
jgi:hypothetical protein